MREFKVITQKIESKNHELLGEVRGDIDIDMNALSFQINIFNTEKAISNKEDIKNVVNDFYYNYFKDALKDNAWKFLSSEPLIMLGVENVTINIGDNFDKMSGVLAKSSVDGDITKDMVVSGEVNINNIGEYKLEYTVKDSIGNNITIIRTVIVQSDNDKTT